MIVTITTIFTALILFGIIVLVHEAGHFLVAKWVGIPAGEFSIGMGPKIYQHKGEDTLFSIRALPIGGYVKFIGEDEKSNDPRAFGNAKVWKRILVIISGPLMNFLLAVLLLALFFMFWGTYNISTDILKVEAGSPAEEAGFHIGDKIIGINGYEMDGVNAEKSIDTFRRIVEKHGNKSLEIIVHRDDMVKTLEVLPMYSMERDNYEIGIIFGKLERHSLISGLGLAFIQTGWSIVTMPKLLINLIFQGQGVGEVMGPIGIVGEIGRAVRSGLQDVINLAIVITLNLGIMNLIPFPALDGGRLVLLVVEGLRGRPMDQEKEGYIHFIGFVILMLIMVLVTFKDVARQWF